jgi:Fic family protein
MSRLITTLLLYQSGFMVGKYISLEQKIERTKETYYDVLGNASSGWHEGKNDSTSFIKYFLGIILGCYRDLKERLGSVDRKRDSAQSCKQHLGRIYQGANP